MPSWLQLQMTEYLQWPLLVIFLLYILTWKRANAGPKNIPIIKYNRYLPEIFNRFFYYPKAWSMIQRGYEQYREAPFRMLTGDGEVVVLPAKYLGELKHLPPSTISSLEAQYEFPNEGLGQNALGKYTNIIISSYLPSNTVRKCLTPGLGMSSFRLFPEGSGYTKVEIDEQARVIPLVMDELQDAFEAAIPSCDDVWIPLQPHKMFVRLIARATSRIAAGEALSHNEDWLVISSSYTVNVGLTLILLRPFPNFLRPFVAPFLPPVRQMKKQLRYVKQLFVPIIEERRESEAAKDPKYEKPDDFLQWMMDGVESDQDYDPAMLGHHMLLIMSMAIIHTSSIAMTQALYDLIARPEYLTPLREEIQVTMQNGWENATKASFDAQQRMDSFMRESQRFNPPGDLSMHRIVKKTLTLSGGLVLPEGTHICVPAGPMTRDSSFIAQASTFDGFRWCRHPSDRNALGRVYSDSSTGDANPELDGPSVVSTTSMSYVSLNPAAMHFGYGRQACPGRFFAGFMIKAILSRVLIDYDFKFETDRTGWRPANIYVGEHILPNTQTTVMFRKRKFGI